MFLNKPHYLNASSKLIGIHLGMDAASLLLKNGKKV
jgi:hypothetical protein